MRTIIPAGPPTPLGTSSEPVATSRGVLRAVLMAAALLAAAGWFGTDALALAPHRDVLDPSGWLRLGASCGVAGLASWLATTYLLGVLGTLPGRTGAAARGLGRWLAPAVVRRVVALALAASAAAPGVAAAAELAAAQAGPVAVAGEAAHRGPAEDLPDPRLRPDRPPAPSGTPQAPPSPPTPRQVRVRPGDTLWDLAAADLGGRASAARIAVEWPRWFAQNRHIGPDPDLIHPGQVLAVPDPDGAPR